LQVPADITLPGVGFLSAQVALNLPEGLELPVYLEMDIPLETSIPISITVPVAIQMKDTELYPEFEKLGETDPMFKELAAITARHNGLWSAEAEKYLLSCKA